jgi:hypothetical protein
MLSTEPGAGHDLEIHNAMFSKYGSTYRPREVSSAAFREQIRSAATVAGAIVFDPRKSLCGTQGCIYEIANVPIYTDQDHIAVGQSGILDADLAVALRQSANLSATDGRK